MNLSEALDAALPEIPRTRLSRKFPPCIDPDLIVREDVTDGEPIVAVFQRSTGNHFRLTPLQWHSLPSSMAFVPMTKPPLCYEPKPGIPLTPEEVRLFAENMDEADFWYQTPQEKNIALNEKLMAQRHRRREATPRSTWPTYRSPPGIRTGTLPGSTRGRHFRVQRLVDAGGGSRSSSSKPWSSWANGMSSARTYRFFTIRDKTFADLLEFWLLFLIHRLL